MELKVVLCFTASVVVGFSAWLAYMIGWMYIFYSLTGLFALNAIVSIFLDHWYEHQKKKKVYRLEKIQFDKFD